MPLWIRTIRFTAEPRAVDEALPEHLEQVGRLSRAGRLHFAGTLGEREGRIEIYEAPDRLAAEAIARESPIVSRGLGAWSVEAIAEDHVPAA